MGWMERLGVAAGTGDTLTPAPKGPGVLLCPPRSAPAALLTLADGGGEGSGLLSQAAAGNLSRPLHSARDAERRELCLLFITTPSRTAAVSGLTLGASEAFKSLLLTGRT